MKKTEESFCNCCKWYECYDDGDGYWDIWCDNGNVFYWNGPPEIYPKDCKYYEEDK